jgi:hypothetical protein
MDFRNCLPNVHPLDMKSGRESSQVLIGLVRFADESSFVPCTFRLLQSGALTQVAVSQGGIAPVQRERNGPQSQEIERENLAKASEFDRRAEQSTEDRLKGRYTDVAECYRLLA